MGFVIQTEKKAIKIISLARVENIIMCIWHKLFEPFFSLEQLLTCTSRALFPNNLFSRCREPGEQSQTRHQQRLLLDRHAQSVAVHL